MGHNLDINDGVTSFVSAHTMGWHQLGQLLEDTFTAEQAMEYGKLGGWNVRKVPMTAADPDSGLVVPVPEKFAVVRDNPIDASKIDALGVVGTKYTIVQNEAHAGFLNALVDESGAHFDTAGALDGGRKVFITMKMPGHIQVGGKDLVENYIAAVNSHDGSGSFTIMVTPVRVVCQNTLNAAFMSHSNVFRVPHTSGIERVVRTEARAALDMTFKFLDGFQEQAEQLINTTLTQQRFEEIIAKEFGAPKDAPAATRTRSEQKIDAITELFADAQTQEGIRDTAWAGFNALVEWADHYAPTRGEDKETARAEKAVLYPVLKNRALELMLNA